MAGESVQCGVVGRIATVTLNRPDRRNAMSLEFMRDLITELRSIGSGDDADVVIIAGAGPAFSAGHDLAEMTASHDDDFYRQLFDTCVELMLTVHEIRQPVIARVHGVATAAGCQLVAACDLAVCSDRARFATPGVNIGLFCSTPMVPISRAVGRKRAMEMLLTGTLIDAATAVAWGLVNYAVPEADLDAKVAELANKIVAASPAVVALGKRAFYDQIDTDEAHAYAVTSPVMARNARMSDAQEGMRAFLEKRTPRWTGT